MLVIDPAENKRSGVLEAGADGYMKCLFKDADPRIGGFFPRMRRCY